MIQSLCMLITYLKFSQIDEYTVNILRTILLRKFHI